MASVSKIEINKRPFSQTKGELSQLRESGAIPGIIYGGGSEPEGVSVCTKDFLKELSIPGVRARVFSLSCGGKALVKDIQFHPVTDKPLHIDFYRLTDGTIVNVKIPLHLINQDKSPGIKRGGVVNVTSHFIELSVPANDIPAHITVDLAGLEVGRSIHLCDLSIPAGARALHFKEDDTVVTIVAPSGLTSSESGASDSEEAAE